MIRSSTSGVASDTRRLPDTPPRSDPARRCAGSWPWCGTHGPAAQFRQPALEIVPGFQALFFRAALGLGLVAAEKNMAVDRRDIQSRGDLRPGVRYPTWLAYDRDGIGQARRSPGSRCAQCRRARARHASGTMMPVPVSSTGARGHVVGARQVLDQRLQLAVQLRRIDAACEQRLAVARRSCRSSRACTGPAMASAVTITGPSAQQRS